MNIVLVHPEIPGNTGAIGRTCVALEAKLWLVRPLGFRVDEKTLRRAGLDYWQYLEWEAVDHWEHLLERLGLSEVGDTDSTSTRLWFFSRFATQSFTEVSYRPGDTLVFGCETKGLPESITAEYSERLLRIPTGQHVRSLNLSCSAGVAGYEASRQIEW